MLANHLIEQGALVFGLSRDEGTIVHERYRHVRCDVRDAASVRTALREVKAEAGRLDLLINNAGVATSQLALMVTSAAAEEMLLTNLLGPLLVTREAAKLMRVGGGGRVVNIGSMMALIEPVGGSVYAACKAGLTTMTAVLAKEFAGYGITCNTVGLTAIATDMARDVGAGKLDEIIAGLPLPRYAEEDDICNVVDFFASDRSSYITAQTVYLGGLHA